MIEVYELNQKMMMKIHFTTCALLLGAAATFAQTTITSDTNQPDSSTVDVQYLSSAAEGQYRMQQWDSDTVVASEMSRLQTGDKLPSKLRRVLQKETRYKGWERSGVYLDEATNLYMVSVSEGNTSRTYGLNVYGKPVLVTEVFRKGMSMPVVDGD